MELTFEKEENWYVSEFKVKGDFNLHIEKEPKGEFYLYQRTSSSGQYDIIQDFGYKKGGDNVIDLDLQALVYPKWIKIKSSVNPTLAVVTMASSNSEGDSDDTDTSGPIEYHFEIPMEYNPEPAGSFMGCMEGQIEGDFSELVEKIYKYAMKNGYDTGYSFDIDDSALEEDIKITVNGDLANHGLCAYYDENGNVVDIDVLTNGNMWMEEARLVIYPTKAVYTEGQ